jgi:hypothetical protein
MNPLPENSILVYPNPAHNNLTIENKLETSKETDIHIFNILGKQVYESKFLYKNPIEFNISNLAKGIYMINIQTDKGARTQKLIVQ